MQMQPTLTYQIFMPSSFGLTSASAGINLLTRLQKLFITNYCEAWKLDRIPRPPWLKLRKLPLRVVSSSELQKLKYHQPTHWRIKMKTMVALSIKKSS